MKRLLLPAVLLFSMCTKDQNEAVPIAVDQSTANVETEQTQVIAHKGAWKTTGLPENSIAALQAAINLGVWGSEFDVQLTNDNVLIVSHDLSIDGQIVTRTNYAAIQDHELANGETLPTAEQFIVEGLKQSRTKLIFELKTDNLSDARVNEAAEECYDLVARYHAIDLVEFISFDYDACVKLRELDENLKVHYIASINIFTNSSLAEVNAAELTGVDYPTLLYKLNPSILTQSKQYGLKTNVWTVNTASDMQYFIDREIDYITTDEPEMLMNMLNDN